jgi:hypothetical protein
VAVLTLRLDEALHAIARIAAAERGQSLQAWLVDAVRLALDDQASQPGGRATRAAMEGQA